MGLTPRQEPLIAQMVAKMEADLRQLRADESAYEDLVKTTRQNIATVEQGLEAVRQYPTGIGSLAPPEESHASDGDLHNSAVDQAPTENAVGPTTSTPEQAPRSARVENLLAQTGPARVWKIREMADALGDEARLVRATADYLVRQARLTKLSGARYRLPTKDKQRAARDEKMGTRIA